MPANKARRYCFTWNNYTQESEELLKRLFSQPSADFRYVAYGKEKGEEKNTPHLQGYMCMWKPKTLKQMKQISPKISYRVMKGDLDQNDKYCSKDSILTCWGDKPAEIQEGGVSGNKMDQMCQDIKDGMPEVDLFDKWGATYLRVYKGVGHVIGLKKPPPKPTAYQRKEVFVCFGNTQTGKSMWARSTIEKRGWAMHLQDCTMAEWWDGYEGQEAILLDEFRGGHMKLKLLLRLLDGYPLKVQIKGNSRLIDHRTRAVFITTNKHPLEWYKCFKGDDPNEWAQLDRRINNILEFVAEVNGPEDEPQILAHRVQGRTFAKPIFV